MNSIMQEASSLAKAVEQAWLKAGKPQKFSIRVFEDAEKNFLGITTKPAKIALLFEKEDVLNKTETDTRKKDASLYVKTTGDKRPSNYPPTSPEQRKTGTENKQPQQRPEIAPRKPQPVDKQPAPQQARPTSTAPVKAPVIPAPVRTTLTKPLTPVTPRTEQTNEQDQDQENRSKIFWTDEMISISTNWVQDALNKMDRKDMTFTTEIKRYHLKFSFNKPISDDPEKQKNLFRNYAYLIMQTVRNRLKKQLKYHKIVLTSDH